MRKVEFRSVFHAPSKNFKILVIHNVLAHGKSYKHGFMKKRDDHKRCAMSCAKSSFDHFSCTVSEFQNTSHSHRIIPWQVVRARFRKKMRQS
ncbi:hypothetical protein B296_00024580 [Ensete ventricosum]|uniref:Uncharacterized protein n=1 Tax=Ensete ventricosum TaxID=4639 RepID=A0A426ZVT6_ENSVE|nr:hypothetical protein B296_00024580 [Ensete ventricosum]